MKKNKLNQRIEYFSLALILSYLILHNIFLVLIGIMFSIYLINSNLIDNYIWCSNKNDKNIKASSINKKLIKKDIDLKLVEAIEELGFIPSLEKDDDTKVA